MRPYVCSRVCFKDFARSETLNSGTFEPVFGLFSAVALLAFGAGVLFCGAFGAMLNKSSDVIMKDGIVLLNKSQSFQRI